MKIFSNQLQAVYALIGFCLLLTYGMSYAATVSCTPSTGFSKCSRITYSGANQTFTVPDKVSSLKIKVWGAGGGGNNSAYYNVTPGGGGGGYATGTLAVSPNQVLNITVGQGGVVNSTSSTFGGGGAGGASNLSRGSSGGGLSAVWSGTPFVLGNQLIIAGGGGGASSGSASGLGSGGGGGLTGGAQSSTTMSGQGGTQTTGGNAATFSSACTVAAQSGLRFTGGKGADTVARGEGGAGGGAGWFGGGGSTCQPENAITIPNSGAGGGSAYIASASLTSATTTAGGTSTSGSVGGLAGNTTDTQYVAGIARGGNGGVSGASAGNGMVVIEWIELTISGIVFQDTNADLLNSSQSIGDSNNPVLANQTVRLFNSSGVQLETTTTSATGNYSFTVTELNTHFYVVVDAPVQDLSGASALLEQTYAKAGVGNAGTAGSAGYGTFCINSTYVSHTTSPELDSTASNPNNGSCFAGRQASVTDSGTTTLNTKEHVIRVVTDAIGSNISNVNFGFSANVVTNVGDTLAQGTLRQFVANSNAITGSNVMKFVPALAQNAGSGTYWSISSNSTFPSNSINITDNGTTIDGKAFSLTDATTIIDSNAGTLGYSAAVGVGADGVLGTADDISISAVNRPELELISTNGPNTSGLFINAQNGTIQNMAVLGFGNPSASFSQITGNIAADISNMNINNNIIGTRANSLNSPGFTQGNGIDVAVAGSNIQIKNNVISYGVEAGVFIWTASTMGVTIAENTIRNGRSGVWVSNNNASTIIQKNHIENNTVAGINFSSSASASTSQSFINNNITGNAVGILLTNSNNTISQNLISTSSAGSGVAVKSGVANTISKNSIFSNSVLGIDLTQNEVTVNDENDSDTGANQLQNFPLIASAILDSGNVTIKGCAPTSASTEFFITDQTSTSCPAGNKNTSGNGSLLCYGEGKTFIGSVTTPATGVCTHTGGIDGNSATGLIDFSLVIPAGTMTSTGSTYITSTATVASSTSEFSPNMIVTAAIKLKVNSIMTSRANASDQFITQLRLGVTTNLANTTGTVVSSTTSSPGGGVKTFGATSSFTASNSFDAGVLPYVFTQIMDSTSTSTLSAYQSSIICSNTNTASTTLIPTTATAFSSTAGLTITPNSGDDISCTIQNVALPKITIAKHSKVAVGTFTFSANNGFVNSTVTTTSVMTPSSAPTLANNEAQSLEAANINTVISETVPFGWVLESAVCIDQNASVTGNPTGNVIGQITADQVFTIPAANVKLSSDLICTFINRFDGLSISGFVFNDAGIGLAGGANDGIQNGLEVGIGNVAVQLTNCSGTVLANTITQGNGAYTLYVPSTVGSGDTICIEEINTSYTSTNVAPSFQASYDRALDKISLVWAASSVSGVNFGNVVSAKLVGNNQKTVAAGSTVTLPHRLTPGTKGLVDFSIQAANSSPNLTGWNTVIYLDANCDANLNTDDSDQLLSEAVAVVANQELCLLIKVFSPENAPDAALYEFQLKANFELDSLIGVSELLINTDQVQVAQASLELIKKVRNVTLAQTFSTSNAALPGHVLEYEIKFVNTTSHDLANFSIHDATPSYTVFLSASCPSILPTGLITCVVPSHSTGSAPSVNSSGIIRWDFTGAIQAGTSGAVTYQVKVQE